MSDINIHNVESITAKKTRGCGGFDRDIVIQGDGEELTVRMFAHDRNNLIIRCACEVYEAFVPEE